MLPKIWLGEFATVIEATAQWSEEPELGGTLAALHAGALRNSVELEYGRDFARVVEGLAKAATTLDEAAHRFGYGKLIIVEIPKLVQQMDYALRHPDSVPTEVLAAFGSLVDRHLQETCRQNWTMSLDSAEVQGWIRGLASHGVTFHNPHIRTIALGQETEASSPAAHGTSEWVQTEVYYRPARTTDGEHRRFLFTRDTHGTQYFIDFGSLDDAGAVWETIGLGDGIEVLPGQDGSLGLAWPTRRSRLVVGGSSRGRAAARPTDSAEARHLRALRKQGIRLVEPGLLHALVRIVTEVFAAHGGTLDKGGLLHIVDVARREGLPSTLTDIRKVRSLLYKAHVLELQPGGRCSLLAACKTPEGLRIHVQQAVEQRLSAELGAEFDVLVAQRLMGQP